MQQWKELDVFCYSNTNSCVRKGSKYIHTCIYNNEKNLWKNAYKAGNIYCHCGKELSDFISGEMEEEFWLCTCYILNHVNVSLWWLIFSAIFDWVMEYAMSG